MRVTLLLAHEIEEYQQVMLMHELGHEVLSLGAYLRPSRPGDAGGLRPPLPQVPEHPALIDAIGPDVEAAKRHLPDEVVEWTDVLIVHHLEHSWLVPQWERLRDRMRVIWRTVGQSTHANEWMMGPLRRQGLEVVRYSPAEWAIPDFAGADALIRFWMDPDEWCGWEGGDRVVTNVTQDLYRRSLADDGTLQPAGQQWTSWQFWEQATAGLPRMPAGPGSLAIDGGVGPLPLPEMHALLRSARAYLYTGTQPASYTLGFIEALMTGIPLVSIGPAWHRIQPYGPGMFEAHLLSQLWSDRPSEARAMLQRLLDDDAWAAEVSAAQREAAIGLFGKDAIRAQWAEYLGAAVPARELVPA